MTPNFINILEDYFSMNGNNLKSRHFPATVRRARTGIFTTAFTVLTCSLMTACAGTKSQIPEPRQAGSDEEQPFSCTVDRNKITGSTEVNPAEVKVHDGDTIKVQKKKYRLVAVDTAECKAYFGGGRGWPDQYGEGDFADVNYCKKGKEFVDTAIHDAKKVEIVDLGITDKYGRGLAFVIADGVSIQCELVRTSLAYETVHTYGPQGQDYLSGMVMEAAYISEQPHFEDPHVFRHTAHQ